MIVLIHDNATVQIATRTYRNVSRASMIRLSRYVAARHAYTTLTASAEIHILFGA